MQVSEGKNSNGRSNSVCRTIKNLPINLKYVILLVEEVRKTQFVNTEPTTRSIGRDSEVGIAIHYGLDGPGIESRWGRDFPHTSRLALWPTQPPIQRVPGVSRE
jgi:hypothetical protein